MKDTEEICFQHGPKIFRRCVFDSLEDPYPRVVDENVETFKRTDGFTNQTPYLIVIAHIANKTNRAAFSEIIQFSNRLIDLSLMTRTDADRHTFANQCVCDAAANAFRAPGYDCNLVCQFHRARVGFQVATTRCSEPRRKSWRISPQPPAPSHKRVERCSSACGRLYWRRQCGRSEGAH